MNFVNKLIYGRDGYSPSAKKILSEKGNRLINKITIFRQPLSFLLSNAINLISLGEFERNKPYDKLYHLFIICFLDDGSKLLIEKNAVINLVINPHNYFDKNTEYLEINSINPISVNTLLNKTQEQMGNMYFPYDSNNNNCQKFIISILKANNLNTPETEEFVYQDLKELFEKLPFFTKPIMDTTTQLGARFDVLQQGGKMRCSRCSNGMTGQQIENVMKHRNNFNGVFMKDELSKNLKYGWYIVNMESSKDGNGTHWCAFKSCPGVSQWFDSFGVIPPIEILTHTNNSLVYNAQQIQDIHSSCCGWFSIACILYDHPTLPSDKSLNRFIHCFSSNTFVNDSILNKLLLAKGINGHLKL